MRVELPGFKRCCCCLPLRYGLLGWGYIKLIIEIFLLFLLILNIIKLTIIVMAGYHMLPLIIMVLMLMALLLDIGMVIVFLIGGHKKTVRLLNIYFIYSIVELCVCTILSCIITGFNLYFVSRFRKVFRTDKHELSDIEFSLMALAQIIAILSYIGVDAYVILLLRSEIKKLSNNCNFRFANVANEAQCSMENGTIESVNETSDLKNGTDDTKIGICDQKHGIDDQYEDSDQADRSATKHYNYSKF